VYIVYLDLLADNSDSNHLWRTTRSDNRPQLTSIHAIHNALQREHSSADATTMIESDIYPTPTPVFATEGIARFSPSAAQSRGTRRIEVQIQNKI